MMNDYTNLIIEGIQIGDQIGGPSELAKILTDSLNANKQFNEDDLRLRYLNWWKSDAFDTGPTYASVFNKIDKYNTVTHSKKLIKLIRKKIGFRNILISDDLSMKSLKGTLQQNTIKTFNAGCNLALHCNGNLKEMEIVGKNSPLIDKFISKKTSQFYKIIS